LNFLSPVSKDGKPGCGLSYQAVPSLTDRRAISRIIQLQPLSPNKDGDPLTVVERCPSATILTRTLSSDLLQIGTNGRSVLGRTC
jgi:hypothetical protein